MTLRSGTPIYRAPEVFEDDTYDHKADICSLGIMALEMLTGEPIFTARRANNNEWRLFELWNEETYYKLKKKLSIDALQFLQYTLQRNPDDRLDADELFDLDFISNAYNDVEYRQSKLKRQVLSIKGQIELE